MANADAKCATVDGETCCAEVFTSGGYCCEVYACDGASGSGGDCSPCLYAETVDPHSQGSDIVELAGVEQITVNNTVLDLQLS